MRLIDRIIEKIYFKRFPERNPKSYSIAEFITQEKSYKVRNIQVEEVFPLVEYYSRFNDNVDVKIHFINQMRNQLINYITFEEAEDFEDRINHQVRIHATLKVLDEVTKNETDRC